MGKGNKGQKDDKANMKKKKPKVKPASDLPALSILK